MKLLHLYSDYLNLYGEYGNISYLAKRLTEVGFDVETVKHHYGEQIDFSDADFIYCGSGTEKRLISVNDDILKYKNDISEYIADGKSGLFTGNASELSGSFITDADGIRHNSLSIFDYETVQFREKRITGDVIAKAEGFDQSFIGFINKSSETNNNGAGFLTITNQFCNYSISDSDGSVKNNFYATHFIGPFLIKNYFFCEYMIKKFCEKYNADYREPLNDEPLEAYKISLSELLGKHEY